MCGALSAVVSMCQNVSDVCQKLSLPSSFQCFARGGSIKGKYRKSKSKGLGPLTLVNSLRELQSASKLNSDVKKKIAKDLVAALMKMCVGTSQKAIIRKFQQGDYSEIVTFAKSLVVIKPRCHVNQMLPYACLYHVDKAILEVMEFSGWIVFYAMTRASMKFYLTYPSGEWKAFAQELYIHMAFGTEYEDLGILSAYSRRSMKFYLTYPSGEWKAFAQELYIHMAFGTEYEDLGI